MAALPLQDRLDQENTRSTTFDMIVSQFGDGYSQRQARGINNRIDKWVLGWKSCTAAERNIVLGALNNTADGSVLTWQPDGELLTQKFTLDFESGYSFTIKSGNLYDITASLIRVYDI